MKILFTIFFLFLPASVLAECISGDCDNGYGTYIWSNGSKYNGEWKNNSMDGQGTLTDSNGGKYVGGYKNDLRHGLGFVTFGIGEWEGDKYLGEYKNDLFHGRGTYIFSGGQVITSIFKNGELVSEN